MSRYKSSPNKKNQTLVVAVLAILACIAVFQVSRAGTPYEALLPEDPITGDGGGIGGAPPSASAPASLPTFGGNVYQGLIAVTRGEPTTAALMEIGNAGKEIASTARIQLRPDSLTGILPSNNGSTGIGGNNNSIRIERNATTGRADVFAPGGVCFGSGTCQDTWPTGSSTSYWDLITNSYLQPATPGHTLKFSADNTMWSNALELVANNSDHALLVNNINISGSAAQFEDGATVKNNFLVEHLSGALAGKEIVINKEGIFYPVWYVDNDGHGSGLDASKIDGYPIEFQISNNSTTSCDGSAPYTNKNCFCADFGFWNGGIHCVQMRIKS